MKEPQLFISDRRMLELMEYCVENNVNGIERNSEFLHTLDFAPNNMDNLKKGLRGFTKEQLLKACEAFGVSMDWLFGLSNVMLRSGKKETSMQLLKRAVRLVEQDIQAAKPKKSAQTKAQTK